MDRDRSILSQQGLDEMHQMSYSEFTVRCIVPEAFEIFKQLRDTSRPHFWHFCAFLSKVELEPVREMRALVDGFLLLAPCNSMGCLVQERFASVTSLESQKNNKGCSISGWCLCGCVYIQ